MGAGDVQGHPGEGTRKAEIGRDQHCVPLQSYTMNPVSSASSCSNELLYLGERETSPSNLRGSRSLRCHEN